jgi:hypothetical protein
MSTPTPCDTNKLKAMETNKKQSPRQTTHIVLIAVACYLTATHLLGGADLLSYLISEGLMTLMGD